MSPPNEPGRLCWAGIVVLVYAALVGAQYLGLGSSPLMSLFYDEFLYDEMAYEIANGEAPAMNYTWPARYPSFYPATLAPVHRWFDADRFLPGRLVNVLLYTTLLFGVFAVARRFLSRWLALVAGIAAVVGPGLFIPPYFLAENLYYPLSILYLLTVIRLAEVSTPLRAAVAGAAAAACFWTKLVAIAPVVTLTAALLFVGAPSPGQRVRMVLIKSGVAVLLLLPLTIGAVGQSVASTASETTASAELSLDVFATLTGNHFMCVLLAVGPLLAGGALAAAARSDLDRRARIFAFVFVLASILVGAVWISLVRPNEPRVEERYQIAAYGILVALALAGMRRPSRGLWVTTGLLCAAVFLPTFLLSPDRPRHWIYVSPGPAPLRDLAVALGPLGARIAFVLAWIGLALLLWRRSLRPLVAISIIALYAAGFVARATDFVADPEAETRALAERSLGEVDLLLRRHATTRDGVIFAGRMHPSVPYAACALHRRPYWSQADLESPEWYPGSFHNKTGRFRWKGRPIDRLLVASRDAVTRGGRLLATVGDWSLYELDKEQPKLHSFLVAPDDSRWFDPYTSPPVEIYLFEPPAGTCRRLVVTSTHGRPRARFVMYRPHIQSGWLEIPAEGKRDFVIPELGEAGLSRLDVDVELGGAKMRIVESVRDKP